MVKLYLENKVEKRLGAFMNKKVSYILFLLIAFILLGGKVNADDTCPLQAKSKLRQMASNVTVSYVPYDSGGAGVPLTLVLPGLGHTSRAGLHTGAGSRGPWGL